jgi:hypothetical protein
MLNAKCLIPVFFCLSVCPLLAQDEASPLKPDLNKPDRLGAILGFSALRQQGSFTVDCNCDAFTGGGGWGLLLGAFYEGSTISSVTWGIQVGYNHREIDARYLLNEDTTLSSSDGKSVFKNIEIPFRHTSNVSLSALFTQPYVKWFPLGQKVFLRLGAAANIVISSNKNFHKILLTNSVILPNDDVVRIELDRAAIEARKMKMASENDVIIQDGPMTDINTFQLALQPALGLELRVGKRMLLVPVIEYSIPVNGLSNKDTDFRLQELHFIFELHVQLGSARP